MLYFELWLNLDGKFTEITDNGNNKSVETGNTGVDKCAYRAKTCSSG